MEESKVVLAEEVLRRFEALEAKLESTMMEVAFWRERAVKAETLLAAKNSKMQETMEESAASTSESETVEGPAEATAPSTAAKEGRGPVTDSSDGEGYQSSNRRRRRKRARPVSSSEDNSRTKTLSTEPGQRRDPRQGAQTQTTKTSQPEVDIGKKKQANPAAQQLDAEQQNKQATPAAQQQSQRRTKVPPIVLREKDKYDEITRRLMDKKINYGCGVTTKEGVSTHPPTAEDYRQMIRVLDTYKYQYHTYQMKEEKQLRVVVRGIVESWSDAKIG
ncbi:uncharacterized protein LOC125502627 [Dendroctonus ponderosae]|uniref:uncharacterized protein LOC125502627 n=1 Tax=Dendroctonus ponderosae TaxID=77166 RepID=UPI00203635AB|nr:uncharacterized protein LOC125502627 [Dendroctonus ponderosae]